MNNLVNSKSKHLAMRFGGQMGVAIAVEYMRGNDAFNYNNLKKDGLAIGLKELFIRPVFQSKLMEITNQFGLSYDESILMITFLEYALTFALARGLTKQTLSLQAVAMDSTIYTVVSYAMDEFYKQIDVKKTNE